MILKDVSSSDQTNAEHHGELLDVFTQLACGDAIAKDDGVFTYIDEQAASVKRSTQLNDEEITLSEEQNNIIHGVAMKQIHNSRFAVDPEKAVTIPSSASDGRDDSEMTGRDDGAEECEEHDEEGNDDGVNLNPQPFTALFARMAKPENRKRTGQQAGVRPPNEAKRPRTGQASRPGPASTSSRSRVTGENGDVAPTPFDFDMNSDQGREDASLIESYLVQYKELKRLDAPCDDQSFNPWSRSRMQKLQELRAGIKSKVKSLKRRNTDANDLKAALDEIADKITDVMTFLKKLGSANTEGRELYDELVLRTADDVEYAPSDGVWERCIRGLAFEDCSVTTGYGFSFSFTVTVNWFLSNRIHSIT